MAGVGPPSRTISSEATMSARCVIDLTESDDEQPELEDDADAAMSSAEDNEEELLECEEITKHEFLSHTRHAVATEIPANHEMVQHAPLPGNGRLELGADIELDDQDFMRIKYIVRNKALPRANLDAYTLRGILLRRQCRLDNMFPKKTNELIAIILVPDGDSRPHFVSGLEDRPLTSFICTREIIFTNDTYPRFSFRGLRSAENYHESFFQNGRWEPRFNYRKAATEARLVCRMKAVKRYIVDGKKERLVSNAFRRLMPHEADAHCSKSTVELLQEWRNEDTPGAPSYRASRMSPSPVSSRKRKSTDVIVLDSDDELNRKRTKMYKDLDVGNDTGLNNGPRPSGPLAGTHALLPIQRGYTMMDLFCGSGGASEAAKMAGLRVRYAIDNKRCAVITHRRNHPGSETLLKDVAAFIFESSSGMVMVDVVHSSNPCRFWSPNHTTPGKDDEMNRAIAYTALEAAKKFRPRIATFEQTPGFCARRQHRDHWQMFMHQLTSVGFDVEWRVVKFADYGHSHIRRRLIIFAACPGQDLPKFPMATHGGPGSGLKRYKTVNETISNIPNGDLMHNVEKMTERLRRSSSKLKPAPGNLPLCKLVDTQGAHALHPSGTRHFTLREVLRLQGFPDTYTYCSGDTGKVLAHTEALKMAGDAVPPKPFQPFFAACRKALEKTDEMMATCAPSLPMHVDND